MKIQCCFCKHICCNHEYDEMLDCEIALEESGKPKCYQNNFDKFELEQNEEVCKSYLKAFNEEYGLYERLSMKNNLIEANEIIKSFYRLFKNFTFGTQNYQNLISRTEKFLFYEDKNNNISYDVPFENFMSSAKEEWDDRLRT